jgi:hypothetical protein
MTNSSISETTALIPIPPWRALTISRTRFLVRNFAISFIVLIVLGSLVLACHPHPVMAQMYSILGLSRSVPIILNAKPTNASIGCESTVMLIRHCEKEGPFTTDSEKNRHCSFQGYQRAHFLPTLFGSRWPIPSNLYALSGGRKGHKNFREIEILEPLAYKIGVPINSKYSTKHTQRLADEVFQELRSGRLCGKLTLFAWKHTHLPVLAHALGWKDSPSHYPSRTYDQVWQIKYVYNPPLLYHPAKDHTRIRTRKSKIPRPEWVIYGSVSYQNFDPLTFSFQAGDYPTGGKETGFSWVLDL